VKHDNIDARKSSHITKIDGSAALINTTHAQALANMTTQEETAALEDAAKSSELSFKKTQLKLKQSTKREPLITLARKIGS